ncbi:MlaC/ttg2D family ABC transporter substrate-binding protein [Pseudogemmobacter humi]|uniref:Putative phospholipid-binding protein MlaC n=1 Tax=Pseudogemmobacter humi TaxID=2483812 RepID=A0A3P5WHU5_9RHOB|nr:ABC transporter substrate-binding protein [Pseudogemmobacter humi]VDC21248.1 putative phospholipid-binding protein MlaC precursor [Pseudogemmobacter humi]
MPGKIVSGLSRRCFLGTGLAAAAALGAAPAFALNDAEARALIDKAVGEINAIINSGRSEKQMYPEFEKLFVRYADVPQIARSTLGNAARSASDGQMKAYTQAFQGYISRKYGRRFREFIGGKIEVTGARPLKSYFEVISTAHLKGEAPFEVRWHVSNKSGRNLFFNIIIEGVNMLASERTEIGAMLDRRKGNIDALIEDLKKA